MLCDPSSRMSPIIATRLRLPETCFISSRMPIIGSRVALLYEESISIVFFIPLRTDSLPGGREKCFSKEVIASGIEISHVSAVAILKRNSYA